MRRTLSALAAALLVVALAAPALAADRKPAGNPSDGSAWRNSESRFIEFRAAD